ncbi:MAG: glycosyltransferase family 4 protein, partial [Chitinivibrionales bacterium]
MDKIRSIAVIGNYMPRVCGIATFTTDLVSAVSGVSGDTACWSIAMNDRIQGYNYPGEVKFEINQNRLEEYRLAADYLNINQVDIVSLQHEYGIFGGEEGKYILNFLRAIRMPVVTTFHTVLKEPTKKQSEVLKEVASLSSRVVVMAEKGAQFLRDIYGIPDSKIEVIHHGIPDIPFVDPNFYKDHFEVEGKKVILTFGLLSPNKGIEYMVEALPDIVEKHPEAVYIVVGATHPNIKKAHGEEYRQSLERLAVSKGVEGNIIFYNRFVDIKELCEFLGASDVYVTPYLSEQQIGSGTLAYAMGAGKAIVSTPYWYAEEMLSDNRGILVGFNDSKVLAAEVNRLLSDDNLRNTVRKNAYNFSRKAVWSQVGADYSALFREVKLERMRYASVNSRPKYLKTDGESLPDIKLNHLKVLTDDTGILQHATFTIPDYSHGYCIDDNARALIVSAMARDFIKDDYNTGVLQKKYLSFIQHGFNENNGWYRNFMGYNRVWLEDKGSEDSQGRTVWALGVCAALSEDEGAVALSTTLFHKGLKMMDQLTHPRSIAFALVGIHAYLARFSGDSIVRRIRERLAGSLFERFKGSLSRKWLWFEDSLSYANAKIPQALLLSGEWMQNSDMVEAGYRILDWLIEIQRAQDQFSFVGNRG